MSSERSNLELRSTRPLDPLAAALAVAIRRAIARRDLVDRERRAKLTIVRGGKEESTA